MDLSKYSIDELISLRHTITNIIYSHDDGYTYICKIRSYGRNWVDKTIKNKYSLQDLMYEYDGENGIVDVYTTNPYLGGVYNYGDIMYIESVEDYEKWNQYEELKRLVADIENSLDKWDNAPFKGRPHFEPSFSRDDLNQYKTKLEEYDMSFIPPRKFFTEE